MAKVIQPQCSICQHHEICKYTEEYQKIFNEIRKQSHPLFECQLTCSKFSDIRPVTRSVSARAIVDSVL